MRTAVASAAAPAAAHEPAYCRVRAALRPCPQPPHTTSHHEVCRAAITLRVGYAIAVAVNVVLLLLTVVWPGWQAVPFLTPATAEVIPLVVVSLIVGMAVNIVNLLTDSRALRSVGEIIESAVTIAFALQGLEGVPVRLRSADVRLARRIVRLVIALTMLGCVIAILVHIVSLVRMVFEILAASQLVGPSPAPADTPV